MSRLVILALVALSQSAWIVGCYDLWGNLRRQCGVEEIRIEAVADLIYRKAVRTGELNGPGSDGSVDNATRLGEQQPPKPMR